MKNALLRNGYCRAAIDLIEAEIDLFEKRIRHPGFFVAKVEVPAISPLHSKSTPTELTDQVKDANNRPEAVRNVMTKNVNLWVDAERTWILDDVWMQCVGTTDPADLKGCACWGVFDVSNVSAYVLLFHENDLFQLLPHFWIPEEKMLEKIRKENINYDKWVAEGYVTATPGNVIDYDFVKADVLRVVADYNLRTSAYNRWNSSQTIIDLQNEGMTFNPFGHAEVSKCSSRFGVGQDEWAYADEQNGLEMDERTIRKFSRVVDVALVMFPAYRDTEASVRHLEERKAEWLKTQKPQPDTERICHESSSRERLVCVMGLKKN